MPSRGAERRTGPMQLPDRLALYEQRLVALWERLVTTLGIHTTRVLLDRAIWQTAHRHPDIALIHHDSALNFDALEKSYANRPEPDDEFEAAFTDLVSEMLLILARLLGWEIAQRLAEDIAVKAIPTRPRGPGRAQRKPGGPGRAQEDLA